MMRFASPPAAPAASSSSSSSSASMSPLGPTMGAAAVSPSSSLTTARRPPPPPQACAPAPQPVLPIAMPLRPPKLSRNRRRSGPAVAAAVATPAAANKLSRCANSNISPKGAASLSPSTNENVDPRISDAADDAADDTVALCSSSPSGLPLSSSPAADIAPSSTHLPPSSTGRRNNKVSLNHLINFSFPARQTMLYSSTSSPSGPASNSRNTGRRRHVHVEPFNRQRFVNANFRFVLRPDKDYQIYLADPDIIVEWNDIDQVVMACPKSPSCPICLSPPVAPRVAKCGHVFCWSCIRHYLHLGDRAWRKCPICYDSIYARDLKNINVIAVNDVSSPSVSTPRTLSFTLMKRIANSAVALPRAHFDDWVDHLAPPVVSLQTANPFAKLLLSVPGHMRAISTQDQVDLAESLREHLAQAALYPRVMGADSERPFIEMCISDAQTGYERLSPTPPDAFASAAGDTNGHQQQQQQPYMLRPSAASKVGDPHADARPLAAAWTSSSDASADPNAALFFYQSSDGQLIFLHPLDIKILKSCYGTYESFPDVITVPVLAKQESTVNTELRKKCRYLAHLPLSCDVMFCEVDLHSVVSEDILQTFSRELAGRMHRLKKMESVSPKRVHSGDCDGVYSHNGISNSTTSSIGGSMGSVNEFRNADGEDDASQRRHHRVLNGTTDAALERAREIQWLEENFGRTLTSSSPLGGNILDAMNSSRESLSRSPSPGHMATCRDDLHDSNVNGGARQPDDNPFLVTTSSTPSSTSRITPEWGSGSRPQHKPADTNGDGAISFARMAAGETTLKPWGPPLSRQQRAPSSSSSLSSPTAWASIATNTPSPVKFANKVASSHGSRGSRHTSASTPTSASHHRHNDNNNNDEDDDDDEWIPSDHHGWILDIEESTLRSLKASPTLFVSNRNNTNNCSSNNINTVNNTSHGKKPNGAHHNNVYESAAAASVGNSNGVNGGGHSPVTTNHSKKVFLVSNSGMRRRN